MSTDPGSEVGRVLAVAHARAVSWLQGVGERDIPAWAGIDDVRHELGAELPRGGEPADAVLARLADAVEPGLMASASPRFFGWVMGGTYPVALAADWLTSAWDQNAGMREVTTGVVGAEEIAGHWIAELLGLPRESEVGFTTGATMANFTCLAAARTRVLGDVGWDVAGRGLSGAPRLRFVAGAESHGSVTLAGSLLGFGAPITVAVDAEGRMRSDDLARVLSDDEGPAVVVLQAGNIHSGAFDPFEQCVRVAHDAGAWVHIDGAFGLWAAASAHLRPLMAGASEADSWATDAHKTLNVPYDCGVAIVRDAPALRSAMGMHASYLAATASDVESDPHERVPELSRRARGIPTWAVLRWLGADGVDALVTGLAASARQIAAGLAAMPGVEVLNDVVFTQVCAALADDARTDAWAAALRADGVAFASSSRWHDRAVLRFSVSNAGTDAAHVHRALDAAAAALARVS
ncbi:aminotransferase class V-fold PLP-dependent enzyme [Planococcus sp. APC 4015]|nr:aminotransferase class V-fold PLP-dependent enzyme [Planococcus sp. APC 4015]